MNRSLCEKSIEQSKKSNTISGMNNNLRGAIMMTSSCNTFLRHLAEKLLILNIEAILREIYFVNSSFKCIFAI